MRPIILCGMKHCGKSSLGRILSEDLKARFLDMDDLLLIEAGGEWSTVRELYTSLGRDQFRLFEAQAARRFVELEIPESAALGIVLALGGGTIENEEAMAWLHRAGSITYLNADPKLLFRRVMAGGVPPFLSKDSPEEDFYRIHGQRDCLFREYADVIVPVDDSPKSINAQRLLVALEKAHVR